MLMRNSWFGLFHRIQIWEHSSSLFSWLQVALDLVGDSPMCLCRRERFIGCSSSTRVSSGDVRCVRSRFKVSEPPSCLGDGSEPQTGVAERPSGTEGALDQPLDSLLEKKLLGVCDSAVIRCQSFWKDVLLLLLMHGSITEEISLSWCFTFELSWTRKHRTHRDLQ